MTVLDIHVLGSPILREQAVPVGAITDDIRRLVDSMFETMYVAKGIGLAAPQVGRSERLFVCDVDDVRHVFINPELVASSGRAKAEEGCLSMPDLFGEIERPDLVHMRGTDLDGQTFEVEANELLGRCLQHELDHLNGRLFIDYLSLFKRRSALAKWEKTKSDFPGLRRTLTAKDIAEHHGGDEL